MRFKLESQFKPEFLAEVRKLFPGCHIEINGTDFMQGIPDTTIYWGKHWAKLEFKRSRTARKQPNQDYYIEMFDRMSFARFVTPENQEDVLRELQQAFRPRRVSRNSQPV